MVSSLPATWEDDELLTTLGTEIFIDFFPAMHIYGGVWILHTFFTLLDLLFVCRKTLLEWKIASKNIWLSKNDLMRKCKIYEMNLFGYEREVMLGWPLLLISNVTCTKQIQNYKINKNEIKMLRRCNETSSRMVRNDSSPCSLP